MKRSILLGLFVVFSLGLVASKWRFSSTVQQVVDFPEMKHPTNNLPSKARIKLGKLLFYDPVLSLDSTISCASCHNQKLAFADNKVISPGVEGRLGNRNAPSLANIGFHPTLLLDGFLPTLEQQILVPIEEHAEMSFNIVEVGKRLERNPKYVKLAKKAYNQEPNPFVITRSIATFQRTFISKDSKYDFYKKGKAKLSEAEKRGEDLFFNQLYCAKCHSGFNFTTFENTNNGLFGTPVDSGRMRISKKEVDRDVFKIASLRNIALTAPYMHDGRFKTLDEVIRHYAKGGEKHPNQSAIIQPFAISDSEISDLKQFLQTLTDDRFIRNKKFSQ